VELIRGRLRLSRNLPRCVVAMGNFDGFHRGHQQLLATLREQAQLLQAPAVVITFEPQPPEFLHPERAQPRLMRLREKWWYLFTEKIAYLVCLQFNASLAQCSPHDFVREVLVKQLGLQAIIIGDDFRFGAKRAGDVQLLQELGRQYSFKTFSIPAFKIDGERVSSTRVRQALQADNLKLAEKLLGRNYFLCGKIGRGDARGREWGFPTANIYLSGKPVSVSGVYIVRVLGLSAQPLPGVASVGVRPMFIDRRVLLEVHLLDFNRDIYGQTVTVEFLHKLRDQQVFPSTEKLIEQIQVDVQNTRQFFEKTERL
jgi:riboflavin kinase/FMN adenylyltransferase